MRTLILAIVTLLCVAPVTGQASEGSGPPPGATQNEVRLWAMQQWEAAQRDPELRAQQERQLAEQRRTEHFFASHAAKQRSRDMRFRLVVTLVSLGSLVAVFRMQRRAGRKQGAQAESPSEPT